MSGAGQKGLIVGGMSVQGSSLSLVGLTHRFAWWFLASALLGPGNAMV